MRLQAATGFLLKIGNTKYLVTSLSLSHVPRDIAEHSRQVVFASFGNLDLFPYINQYL